MPTILSFSSLDKSFQNNPIITPNPGRTSSSVDKMDSSMTDLISKFSSLSFIYIVRII